MLEAENSAVPDASLLSAKLPEAQLLPALLVVALNAEYEAWDTSRPLTTSAAGTAAHFAMTAAWTEVRMVTPENWGPIET